MSQIITNSIPYISFQTKHLFVPLKSIYPECFALIHGEPKLHPLFCLMGDCHRNSGCVETYTKKVLYWFEVIEPQAELLVAYFTHPDRPNSLRAGIFHSDMREPYVITLNVTAFEKFKREGQVKYWPITDEYKNIHSTYKAPNIISVESLLKK